MQFAAVMVEYLVTGSGAVIWMGIALGVSLRSVLNLEPAQVALLVPVVYLAGMLADAVAALLLHYPGKRAKRYPLPWQNRAVLVPDLQPRNAWSAFVLLHSPDWGGVPVPFQPRPHRPRGPAERAAHPRGDDRVAVNRAGLLPFLPAAPVTIAAGAALAVLTAVLWWAAEGSTSAFLQTSVALIEHKLARESVKREKPARAGISVPYTARRRDV